MGCKVCKGDTVRRSTILRNGSHETSSNNTVKPETTIKSNVENKENESKSVHGEDTIIDKSLQKDDHVQIEVADPQAFNDDFVQQRQRAINNPFYQPTIQSWKLTSLQQLTELLKALSKGKSIVEQHWFIFYWITFNIRYDTVSYFSKNYEDQSAEGVFRTRKGVCAGYANLYKYLCDQLELPCEVVGGYSKGYGFENRAGAPSKTDHAWNAVRIDNHWYLMESTWGAGHLDDKKEFQRKLSTYYFLPRPNEMIYHHLPEDEKWQLLKTPIKMSQYLEMPKLRPLYFDLQLELVQPCHQAHVDFVPNNPYALVIVRSRINVKLIASLNLNDKEIEGGHCVIFDTEKQLYNCYFAPPNVGDYKVNIYANGSFAESTTYDQVLELRFNVNTMPTDPISYPKTWEHFSNLGLEVISPQNTHMIKLVDGVSQAQILIKTPENVHLLGRLENEAKQEVLGGDQVYYYRRKKLWRCDFAPDRDGIFEATILAKKKTDKGSYQSAIAFKIDARKIASPPVSYPYIWQKFYDLDLKIIAPRHRSNAIWTDNASYAEVLIKAPADVRLSCGIKYDNVNVENGSLAQFNNEKKLWQLLFAPERTGRHELFVYGKKLDDEGSSSNAVVRFYLDVNKLRRPMKFPETYADFHRTKCQIVSPMDGVLKKGAIVPFECFIPGATEVNLPVDSKWIGSEGYTDPILKKEVTVGSKEVKVYGKYGQATSYNGLIKYKVQ